MPVYDRALRGVEAGAIAAGMIEISFFVLDLVRLRPLATPGVLSGASVAPGGFEFELQSFSGVVAALWATYHDRDEPGRGRRARRVAALGGHAP